MKSAVALLLALASPALHAQSLHFGEPAPLATTRYGAFGGNMRLVTNGTDPFLAWSSDGKVRMTRLTDGERRVGRPVMDVSPFEPDAFDVIWTGAHFVAVAQQGVDPADSNARRIAGQFLDASGERIGDPFTIAAQAGRPRLAFDGTNILLVYGPTTFEAIYLDRDGQPSAQHFSYASVSSRAAAVAGAAGTTVVVSPELNEVFILALNTQAAVVGTPRFSVSHETDRQVSVASGNGEFFIVWTNGNAPMEAAVIKSSNATISGRFTLPETGGASAIATAWDGSRWLLAWVSGGAAHARRIDVKNGTSEPLSSQPADDDSPVAAFGANGRAILAWRGASDGAPITVRHLPGGTDLAAFAAAEQHLESTAATTESALIAFTETRDGRSTLYAGLRGVDGSWRETKIADGQRAPLVGTDGSNFAVITTTSSNDWAAAMVDRRGRLVNVSSRIAAFTPTGIAWTGSAYAIVGINSSADLAAYTVSPSAIVTGPVTLAQHAHEGGLIENPTIAARDGETLVVWQDSSYLPCFPICDPYESELYAARFSPSLQRLDADALQIAPDEALFPSAVWDGSRYTIAWNARGKLQWRTLTSHGSVSGIASAEGLQPLVRGPRLAVFANGVAATMSTGDAFFLTAGTTLTGPHLGASDATDAIVRLGNRIGYVQSAPHREMPYHGADRVYLIAGDAIPIGAPADAPHITAAHYAGNTMVITWTPPAAQVHGYRVEYRVNDGYWNELDAWFESDETTLEIQPWRGTSVAYQFRVRAISDGGTGAYSNAATVRSGVRRRAAR